MLKHKLLEARSDVKAEIMPHAKLLQRFLLPDLMCSGHRIYRGRSWLQLLTVTIRRQHSFT